MQILKMCFRVFAVICLMYVPILSSGEEADLQRSFLLNSKNELHRNERNSGDDRYGRRNHDDSESRNENDGSLCSPKNSIPHSNTIIRSNASIENGAKYILANGGVTSREECFNLCCQNSTCDTSIFKEKVDHRCYLFQCRGLCKFKAHKDYTVWELHRRAPAAHREEEELARLHTTGGGHENDDTDRGGQHDSSDSYNGGQEDQHQHSGQGSQGDISPTPEQKPQTPYVAPHTAGLSESCTSNASCEDPNAACFNQACHCQHGFYNKDGLCRKICPPMEFECLALGTLGRGPECVPKSQVCDSYLQCADGSDEFNCDTQDGSSNSQVPSSDVDKPKEPYESDHKIGAPVPSKGKVVPSSPKAHTDDSHGGDNISSGNGESNSKVGTKTPPSPTPKINKTKAKGGKAKGIKVNHTQPPPSHKSHGSVGHSKVFVTQEKVIIASTSSEAEGPIIALSLGLAFTLILIVLLGCRLRNMKHRLRKGRPLNSNEADYLINGMYL